MPIEKIPIEQFITLAKTHPVLDVRSPAEYNHAHIPGAYSLPLFTDEERKIVGTAYKQQSRGEAIKIGLDLFGPKMKKMIEEAEQFSNRSSQPLLIYCWRGGMRSAGVAWLMDLYGFKVFTLYGGYKKFRNYVLDIFKLPFQFKILSGFTGSGKTELLKELKQKGELVIDLEKLAQHKGSAFGNIGMPKQPGQELFENMLAIELLNHAGQMAPIWLEDESQRIGQVNIPNELWKKMRESPLFFLDIPFEERLNHIVEEYGVLDKNKMIEAILRIREKLGGLHAQTAIQLLEENQTRESFRILLAYYDKFYLKSLHNRKDLNSLLYTISCKSVISENAKQLIRQAQPKPESS
jgi:tRNA 2-selenouridine synthase